MNKNFKIAVIGLGYVGLPLSIEFSKKYTTCGFDKSQDRIDSLIKGLDATQEVANTDLLNCNILFTTTIDDISDCNIYIITVPTPIDKNNNPDLAPLEEASRSIGKLINNGDIVIYESTVYPGATEEFCVPILELESNLRYNIDFYCGYSPERINPGDKEHSLKSIVKITSGSNDEIAKIVDELYKSIISAGTYRVGSIAIAEAAKVIENVQRDVNIALINELAIIFNKLNLDTVKILEAAGTKWNFIPFRPGIVGGHCIGVDPYYLTYKAKEVGYHPEVILAGRRINDGMGAYIAKEALGIMDEANISYSNANVAILGLTFKENCPDLRNTKVPFIADFLISRGCNVIVSDPYLNHDEVKSLYNLNLVNVSEIKNNDMIIVAVAHKEYLELDIKAFMCMLKPNGAFLDLKSIYSKEIFKKKSIMYWRL